MIFWNRGICIDRVLLIHLFQLCKATEIGNSLFVSGAIKQGLFQTIILAFLLRNHILVASIMHGFAAVLSSSSFTSTLCSLSIQTSPLLGIDLNNRKRYIANPKFLSSFSLFSLKKLSHCAILFPTDQGWTRSCKYFYWPPKHTVFNFHLDPTHKTQLTKRIMRENKTATHHTFHFS